jgi:3-phosphoshikimate 1-carboxyvinyltransferase
MYRILPPQRKIISVSLPYSKSVTHRIFILAGLNRAKSSIHNHLTAEDTRITLEALHVLGMKYRQETDALHVYRPIGKATGENIFLGNSGSSARFLLPLAAYADRPIHFEGTKRLHKRPFAELFTALNSLGVRYEASNYSLPAMIYPGSVSGGSVRFKELPSSQMVTALMLAALWMEKDLTISLPVTVPSQPYISMTMQMMKRLGLRVDFDKRSILIGAEKPSYDWNFRVEKDLSAASYWVILCLLNDIKVVLQNVTLPSFQGDERIFDIAEAVGGQVMLYEDRVEITGSIQSGLEMNCSGIPDLVPALSVLALFAPEKFTLTHIRHLEFKESNRIEAIRHNIHSLGGRSEYRNGVLKIYPAQKYTGARIKTFDDHRIAMSFAVAGTRIHDIVIDKPTCVDKSYPQFWHDFEWWEEVR